ncbi:MAG: glutamate--tRNA ligase [Candidatus Sungiibacteriota bacterium]
MIRTRIAPSPTGALHIGTARTALFNYLFAKKQGGAFILRIEDTDLLRSDQKYEKDILDSLRWLNINYDEGPYRQSERLETYKKYLEKLISAGNAFYCFHTEAELEAERERLLTEKKTPIHLCEYRDTPRTDAEKLIKEKPEHIIRFKTPAGRRLKFSDLIRGEISFESDTLGDFSLAKDLTVPLYNFAVVIDDYEMKISHVIRGEDHISNTPKQMLIQEALGLPRPEYAHLPLILGPDRAKLSKRHGATSIEDYRKLGYLPEALLNFMALLGWNPGTEQELFSLGELAGAFDMAHVKKSAAVFNLEKLDWLNGEYIRKQNPEELLALAEHFFPDGAKNFPRGYLKKIVALEQPRLKKLSEIKDKTDYFFAPPDYDAELLRWKDQTTDDVRGSIDKSIELLSKIELQNPSVSDLEHIFLPAAEEAGDRGRLLWPLRAALSGKKASLGPFELMAVLGRDEALKRLESARKKLA